MRREKESLIKRFVFFYLISVIISDKVSRRNEQEVSALLSSRISAADEEDVLAELAALQEAEVRFVESPPFAPFLSSFTLRFRTRS